MTKLTVSFEIQIPSRANANYGSWRPRQRIAKLHRHTTLWKLRGAHQTPVGFTRPITILLTRVSPRKLDDDNLQGALKSIRDGVADWLGIDDGSADLSWQYDQRSGRAQGVEINIEGAST